LSLRQRQRADALLDELLELPEATRLSQLHELRGEDPMVLAEVESLLLAARAAGAFLDAAHIPSPDVIPDAAVGMRLGAWHITRLIGRGGMGEVYEATRADGNFEQRVAIKLLQA
jgi:serine/threonine protein kinase